MMKRQVASGYQIIQLIGIMMVTLMISALAIDFGYYFTARNQMQTTADAAALAATDELYRNTSSTVAMRQSAAHSVAVDYVNKNQPGLTLDGDDAVFGFIDPATKLYDHASYFNPSLSTDYALTGGYNSVKVRVERQADSANKPLETIMAKLVGIDKMDAVTDSVAFIDQNIVSITDGGIRPIYACEAQMKKALEDGVLDNNVIRIYGDHLEVDGVGNIANCPLPGSGNWGFADFNNCGPSAVGASTIADWFDTGYPGVVEAGRCYSSKPGNFISSISPELDTLISNKTTFPIPMYTTWGGSGSNTYVNVSGFVGFQISSYKANGAQAGRYIEGHFARYICNKGCTTGKPAHTSPGGAVVKIRLAARS